MWKKLKDIYTINGQHALWARKGWGSQRVRKPPQGASARTRRGRSARWRNSTNNQPSLHKFVLVKKFVRGRGNPNQICAGSLKSEPNLCGATEILNKFVRGHGNPKQICAGPWKSYSNLCGATEILTKFVRGDWNPNQICAGPLKS